MKRRSFLALMIFAALPFFIAQACGPGFADDVFVRKLTPDDPAKYATGQLGVLLPTYPRMDLIVAFRYLNGGTLTNAEQDAYTPTYDQTAPQAEAAWKAQDAADKAEVAPISNWTTMRARYASLMPLYETPKKKDRSGFESYEPFDTNCLPDAYRVATVTLKSRAQSWGSGSPELAEWLRGQDMVFANCGEDKAHVLPLAAPVASSTLLRADRAYQIAAAMFYAGDFIHASDAFSAIATDSTSPWQSIAPYLAARCIVRDAFAKATAPRDGDTATFDQDRMRQAAHMLAAQLKEDKLGMNHRAVQNLLDMVRLRLEPASRVRELSEALAGPKPDPDFRQHLADLTWYLDVHYDQSALREDSNGAEMADAGENDDSSPSARAKVNVAFTETYRQAASIRSSFPMVDWLLTFQSPAKEATTHAVAEWRATHKPYWLLAAITKASASDAFSADLIAAAAQLKADEAGWESFTYHRLRLLIASGHTAEARTELDGLLPKLRASGRDSVANAYTGLRMYASTDLNDLLTYAPQKILLRRSQTANALRECLDVMKNPKRIYDCRDDSNAAQFSPDAMGFFNTQAPLDVLVASAQSSALPQRLRGAVAMMAWVRSVLLKDDATAAKLFPLLPAKLQQQAGAGTGFHPLLAIVRNPGLRPYLDSGIQRMYSYDFVESYRDNWWCGDWAKDELAIHPSLLRAEPVALLTAPGRAQAEREVQQILKIESAKLALGEEVLDYAKDHASDPDVPEALYLVLRMIRWGCDPFTYPETAHSKEQTARIAALRGNAARLLRQRYVTSPWTKKAGPLAG